MEAKLGISDQPASNYHLISLTPNVHDDVNKSRPLTTTKYSIIINRHMIAMVWCCFSTAIGD